MGKGQWDILIYHDDSPHAEELVRQLKSIVDELENDVGEKVKVASTVEHFIKGSIFESMEDALQRCSSMFILITEQLLNDPLKRFISNQVLMDSIRVKGDEKYLPVFESREKSASLSVPSYIKVLHSVNISDLSRPSLHREGLVKHIKLKLMNRKERERVEKQHDEIKRLVQEFKTRLSDIKMQFERQRAVQKGEADIMALKRRCAAEIQKLANDQKIECIDSFLSEHGIDVSFATDETSSLPWCGSSSLSLSVSADLMHNVDALPIDRVPVESDDAVEHEDDGMESQETDDPPPPYATQSTYPVGNSERVPQIHLEELKIPPLSQSPDVVGRADPLEVPPCPNGLEPPYLPKVLDDLQSTTSFSSVPRLSNQYNRDQDVSSMIAECSESTHDTTSLLGSQSHANLTEFDEENMSHCSKSESRDSSSDEDEMDVGENPVDLSLLEVATGLKPLSFAHLNANQDRDDESMVVEVDSTVGEDDTALNICSMTTPTADARPRDPPLRDDDDFDALRLEDDDNGEGSSQLSPGLGELVAHSWPRNRRGSDAGSRRPRQTNLANNRFLSLSSLQSFSSRLFRLHHQPSLNNISEWGWGDRPARLDGIRLRYS